MFPNPLQCKNIGIYGDSRILYEYIDYLNKVMSSTVSHKPDFDNWIITPYQLNAVHFYANFNQKSLLSESISSHGAFYPSRTGHTPLQIAVNKQFVDSIETILMSLEKRLVAGDFWAFYHIGSSLIGLNELSITSLDRVYELSLLKSQNKGLSKFCKENTGLPIVLSSLAPVIDESDFPDSSVFSSDGKAIAFAQSGFRLNLVLGSQDSIDFLESIENCENERIYYSKIIQIILNTK